MKSIEEIWKDVIKDRRRVVVKVGSAVLTGEHGLDETVIIQLAQQVSKIREHGIEVTMVSSGAIASGMAKLGWKEHPSTLSEKQALAALGQGRLMHSYEQAFSRFGITVAQVLLTRDGLIPRKRYINAKNTLKTLLKWGVIPIVNENDTVATEEIQFTDNDALSVLVVNLTESDLLLVLSDVDGLYSEDPRKSRNGKIIHVVEEVTEEVLTLAGHGPGRAGRGGMRSKLEAARLVTQSGVPMIVAKGRRPECILDILFRHRPIGTLFLPSPRPSLHGKRPWIACTMNPEGVLYLDDGAVKALTEGGKSLLPVGIRGIEGDFPGGACVVCKDQDGNIVATGITQWDALTLKEVLGLRTKEISDKLREGHSTEVIHRDNMVVWGGKNE